VFPSRKDYYYSKILLNERPPTTTKGTCIRWT